MRICLYLRIYKIPPIKSGGYKRTMDIRGLRYFISAAECLNFTRAAKECYITQTAMSQHIANMEKELGFQLFRRNNRTVELTVAGKDFYDQVKILVSSYDNAVQRSLNLSNGSEGSITIAIPSFIEALTFLPRLRHFKTSYPAIKLRVSIVPPNNMIEQLNHGECDIALCWTHEMDDNDSIILQNLMEFKACLVCSNEHPLAKNKTITPEMLAKEELILINLQDMPSTYRTMCKDWKQLGLIPPSLLTLDKINSLEELLLIIEMDMMTALVPEFVKNNIASKVSFLDLAMKTPPMFHMGAGYLRTNPNPALQKAIDVLRDSRIPLNY